MDLLTAAGHVRIAVLMTCHNRSAVTCASLRALLANQLPLAVSVTAILVDAGSTDGTDSAVAKEFPTVKLIHGTGDLYWNGGTRMAFAAAMDQGFDFYIWLNDDTVLGEQSLAHLLDSYARLMRSHGPKVIVVGSTLDPVSGELSYGGWRSASQLKPLTFIRVASLPEEASPCDTMNGNCVMIPACVAETLGNLEAAFTHGMGDIDYGLRAKKIGVPIFVVPGYVGVCSKNPGRGSWSDSSLPLRVRWKNLLGPKGLPLPEWLAFTSRHGGWLWPLYFMSPYIKTATSWRMSRPNCAAKTS